MSSPSVNLVGSAPNICFNLIIYCHLLCSDAGSGHPHLYPSLVFTTVVLEQLLIALCSCASSLGSLQCTLCTASRGLSKVSCRRHLTPVLQILQWLFLITRIKPQLLTVACKATPGIQPQQPPFFLKCAKQSPIFWLLQ